MDKKTFDLVVLGGGPGGYVAAIRAVQRGLSVALIDAQVGGTCLNRGCIPSKALIAGAEVLHKIRTASQFGIEVAAPTFDYQKMKERKDRVVDRIRSSLERLILSHKITLFKGRGAFLSLHEMSITGGEEALIEFKQAIIATGSEPRALPSAPFDYMHIHDSTSLLNLTTLPKKLLIIGGGIVGCEFASLHKELDVDVTVVEMLPSLIAPEGKSASESLLTAFKKRGIKVELNSTLTSLEKSGNGIKALLKEGRTLEADIALVAVGRKFNSENIGLEKLGVALNPNGTILVDDYLRTNISHIYAIGDITGKWLLAHVASHQGLIAAENCAGAHKQMHYNAVPSVIFTHPEIATVGLTQEKAEEAGFKVAVGKFPFLALGKAHASIETEGFAQIISDQKTGQILGAQVVGAGASILIAEMALAVNNELTLDSVSDTIHAHPTLAEAWMEAALLAAETPLHLPPTAKAP